MEGDKRRHGLARIRRTIETATKNQPQVVTPQAGDSGLPTLGEDLEVSLQKARESPQTGRLNDAVKDGDDWH